MSSFPRRQSPRLWREELGLAAIERQHGLPAGVLEAIIYVESRGKSSSSGDGGRSDGLFQLMDSTAGRELRRFAGQYTEYGDFRRFNAGIDPQHDAHAAATLFQINHDHYIKPDGQQMRTAELIVGYNAGGPRIGAGGIDAVHSSIYWHTKNGRRAGPGYLPLVITYLRHSGHEETANQLINEVMALPASEVNHARFRDALAYADREHGTAIDRINADATPEALQQVRARSQHRAILSDSDTVKEIQAALGVDDDGRWGRGTQRAFNASGVDRDGNGLISQAELNRLVNPAARTLRMEHRDITDNKDLVRQIQTKLGFTGKDVDGVWGNKTAKAFRDYEGCHTGFNADGMVSRAELNTLTAPPTPPQENRNPVANFFSRFLRN